MVYIYFFLKKEYECVKVEQIDFLKCCSWIQFPNQKKPIAKISIVNNCMNAKALCMHGCVPKFAYYSGNEETHTHVFDE